MAGKEEKGVKANAQFSNICNSGTVAMSFSSYYLATC